MTTSRHPFLAARRKVRARPLRATLRGFLCFLTAIAIAIAALAVLIMAAC